MGWLKEGVSVLLFTLLLFYSAYLTIENTKLSNSLAHAERRIDELSKNITGLKAQNALLAEELKNTSIELNELMDKYEALNESYSEAMQELKNKTASIELFQAKLRRLREEYINLTRTINESIRWFKSNQELPKGSRVEEILESCMAGETLNYPCFIYKVEEEGILTYKAEERDRLKSLDEALKDHTGDCEEFAELAVAALNTAKKKGARWVKLFKEGKGEFKLFTRGRELYYIDDAEAVEERITKAEGACYTVSVEERKGHCVVKMGSVFFEPQTGEVIYDVSLCEEGDCKDKENKVWLLFGDDMKIFENGEGWVGYKKIYRTLLTYLSLLSG